MLPYCPYCGDDLEPTIQGGTLNPATLYEEMDSKANDVVTVVQECATCKVTFTQKVTVEVESTR